MPELRLGVVTHYYSRIGVAALSLELPLRRGDHIHILGHTTDLELKADSLEIDHCTIECAQPGDDVALKVSNKVRIGDRVYLQARQAEPALLTAESGAPSAAPGR